MGIRKRTCTTQLQININVVFQKLVRPAKKADRWKRSKPFRIGVVPSVGKMSIGYKAFAQWLRDSVQRFVMYLFQITGKVDSYTCKESLARALGHHSVNAKFEYPPISLLRSHSELPPMHDLFCVLLFCKVYMPQPKIAKLA